MARPLRLLALAAAPLSVESTVLPSHVPPVFRIEAHSLVDAGRLLGVRASKHIKGWFATAEVENLLRFIDGEGKAAFTKMQQTNAKAFPQYAAELKAIAEGAGVPETAIWAANMLEELEILMPPANVTRATHIFAIAEGGYSQGFSLGHNEDWDSVVKDYWYFTEYVPYPGADFNGCAGMTYPGSILGWATTWNTHGMFLTQNSLFPTKASDHGYMSAFVQREAICGKNSNRGIDAVVNTLTSFDWSCGASVNLVDLKAKRMANIEFHLGDHKVTEVSEAMGNFSHFNMYKTLGPGLDGPEFSTVHRQARADQLPAPRSQVDVKRILGDAADQDYPIFRNVTLSTLVLDGATGQLGAWCCGQSPSTGAAPVQTWNLLVNAISRTSDVIVV